MLKWIIAAVVLVLIGGGITFWEVQRKAAELKEEEARKVLAEKEQPEELPRPSPDLLDIKEAQPANVSAEPVLPPPPRGPGDFLGAPGRLPILLTQGQEPAAPRRLREGMIYQGIGTLRAAGDRMEFVPIAPLASPLILLENQLLQRIAYIQSREAGPDGPVRWQVSGLVTEYRGLNFMLLQTALQAREVPEPLPPPP